MLEPREYLPYLPSCLQENSQFQALAEVLDGEMRRLNAYCAKQIANALVPTADVATVKRWERLLEIPEKSGDLGFRRTKVLSKFKEAPPVNEGTIKRVGDDLLGKITKISYGPDPYTVTIKYRNNNPFGDDDFGKNALRQLLPANLQVNVVFAFVEWQDLASRTWGQLQTKTYRDVMLGNY